MTRFQSAQIVSIGMSAAFALVSWFAALTVPAAPTQFAATAYAVELA